MKKIIWKFPLESTGNQTILMPIGAKILHIETQGTLPCIWALVDPKKQKEPRHIEIYGTGHEIECSKGKELWHLGVLFLAGLSGPGKGFYPRIGRIRLQKR